MTCNDLESMRVVQGATGPQGCSHYFPYPALLLLYDITNKDSFDNIQVSGFLVVVVGSWVV